MQPTLIRKVFTGALIYLGLLAITSAFGFQQIVQFRNLITQTIETTNTRHRLYDGYNAALGEAASEMQQYAFLHDSTNLAEADRAVAELSEINQQIDLFETLPANAGGLPLNSQPSYQQLKSQRTKLAQDTRQALTDLTAAVQRNSTVETVLVLSRISQIERMRDAMYAAFEQADLESDQAVIGTVIGQSSIGMLSVVLTFLIQAAVLFVILGQLRRLIVDPVKRISAAAGQVATGDLEQTTAVTNRDEIGDLQRAFNAMVVGLREQRQADQQRVEAEQARFAAEEASKAKSAFLANMSHELRTPLSSIIGYSELIENNIHSSSQSELLLDIQKIQQAGRHLLTIINDVLDLSKIEAGKMFLSLETFSLDQLLSDVADTIQPLLKKNANQVELHWAAPLGTMRSDSTKLRQVLLNLLGNATKFTERGIITIEVRTTESEVSFVIRDTGIGISADQLKRLFQPFTQATDSTMRVYGGTGLGLTLCRHLSRMMGGTIEVASELGRGSTFTVRLPRILVAPAEPVPPAATPIPDAGRVAIPAPPPIGASLALLIDDDPAACELVRRTLDSQHFTLIVAHDGESGIQLARDLLPDVILLDVLLPGIDGWTVLTTLKSDPELAAVPVVMLSIIDDQTAAYALGAADYLVKPVQRERLGALLQRYTQGKVVAGQAHGRILVVEDDPATLELLQRTLEQSGHMVFEATSAGAALRHLAHERPDLFVIDLNLPDLDGIQLIEAIREQMGDDSPPIVVITAKDLSSAERAHLNRSVAQILAKGTYQSEQLLREVQRLLAGHVHSME